MADKPPDLDAGGQCGYSDDLDEPRCEQAATLHLAVTSQWGEGGIVALATCDDHAAVARAAGEPLDEHPFCPACPEGDRCWVVIPDTGQ